MIVLSRFRRPIVFHYWISKHFDVHCYNFGASVHGSTFTSYSLELVIRCIYDHCKFKVMATIKQGALYITVLILNRVAAKWR